MHRPPNVVVIYTDDLGYGDLGCQGSPDARTPHLDSLAASGVRATTWYSNAPVCSPSRASLLTGLHPDRAGVTRILGARRSTPGLPPDRTTLATRLRGHGYATGLFGKWHLGVVEEHRPTAHGFDEFFGFLAGCVDYYSHIMYWGQSGGVNPLHDLWDGDDEVWHNGRYLTDLVTDRAVDFIDRQAGGPFFCYVPYNAPHYPMHAPREYLDRFPDLPPDRRVMAAMVAAVDDGVGRILDALSRNGIREDTIVVFSSDNGPSCESRNWLDGTEDPYYGGSAGIFRGHKGSLFDGGIREPFLISYPRGLPAGVVCDGAGQMSDVVPTVLALAGLPVPSDVDGVDVSAMLRGGESPHERLFWAQDTQLAVREGRWKLVLDGRLDLDRPGPEPVHLSDVDADPGERVNLAGRYPEIVVRLTAAVRDWHAEVTR
ncbi:sulfatase-like hydrolase/transferase [Actinocatenispora rupis]|uniref:N-acetylgalactosamine-6-sulfatase n=1 Tax=Actinocatenispora rupis TaxID=519421 RepID=A0A8J3J060_9ACTN|nr:sulfatase-like hydrolase/transferase [Actinocatenispora rupis]GID09610.1 N-acetylgalactosamine-6-sulfatase [Actinocatenispora rupis]